MPLVVLLEAINFHSATDLGYLVVASRVGVPL